MKTEEYGVEDMIFVKEEEVFPTIKADEIPIGEEMNATTEKVETKIEVKRKCQKSWQRKRFPHLHFNATLLIFDGLVIGYFALFVHAFWVIGT